MLQKTKKGISVSVEIPQGVTVDVVGNTVKAKGSKGDVEKSFVNPRITVSKNDNSVVLETKKNLKPVQADKMFVNTCRAHLRNIFKGVMNGYTAKLKICSGHFPMTVTLDGSTVVVKNFLGEKVPRKTQVMNGVKVQIQGEIITVTGNNIESVGQTAARIEQLTRITNRDRRIFQDGCFIISKPGDEDE